MHFLIRCVDQAAGPELRKRNFQAHQDYLAHASGAARIVISGPLVASDDTMRLTGSAYLVEAADLESAKAFIESDPYHKAGVWQTVTVDGFLKKTDNRS